MADIFYTFNGAVGLGDNCCSPKTQLALSLWLYACFSLWLQSRETASSVCGSTKIENLFYLWLQQQVFHAQRKRPMQALKGIMPDLPALAHHSSGRTGKCQSFRYTHATNQSAAKHRAPLASLANGLRVYFSHFEQLQGWPTFSWVCGRHGAIAACRGWLVRAGRACQMLQDVLLRSLLKMNASAFFTLNELQVYLISIYMQAWIAKARTTWVCVLQAAKMQVVHIYSYARKVQQPPACPSTRHKKLLQE